MAELHIQKRRIFFQVLFWMALWGLFPFITWSGGEMRPVFLERSLLVSLSCGILVGINIAWLIPRFFFTRKYWIYVLLGLVLIAAFTLINKYLIDFSFGPRDFPQMDKTHFKGRREEYMFLRRMGPYIGRSMPMLVSLIGSALFEIAAFANQQSQVAINLKNENLETEMKFLKSQINPHFLFNALNNIYSLSVLKSEHTSENLLKLSHMLRYMLYDCNTDYVFLHKEVEYIRNLIGLNMLKDSKGLNVETEISLIPPHLKITPLLFIPFIENAFKHSNIEQLDTGWIRLNMSVEDQQVHFDLENSCPREKETKDKQGGIGLVNVKRRLELYYPEKHQLTIQEKGESFHVHLSIDLT